MLGEASVLLKTPAKYSGLKVSVFIPPNAPARTVTLSVDGKVVATQTFQTPGPYTVTGPFQTDADQVTVTLRVDRTHRVAPDTRDLGVVVIGVGFE